MWATNALLRISRRNRSNSGNYRAKMGFFVRAGVTEATVVRIQKADLGECYTAGVIGEEKANPVVGIYDWVTVDLVSCILCRYLVYRILVLN